jgi:hypothetical protein
MSKRGSENWVSDDLLPLLKSKAAVGATFFWLVIWALCGFNGTVGLAFLIPWAGSVGLFGLLSGKRSKRVDRDLDDDADIRGYHRALGHESDELARARQNGEPIAPALPSPFLHRQVIADAAAARLRLEAAASVGEGQLGVALRNMLAKVRDVESGLEADPSRLSDVQRLFTYYLPATADLLAARGGVAGSSDTTRLGEIDTMIGKLNLAYSDFADRLRGHDSRSLEIDLRLLDRALDEEFLIKAKG